MGMTKEEMKDFCKRAGMKYTEIPDPKDQVRMTDPIAVDRMRQVVTTLYRSPDRWAALNDFTLAGYVRMLDRSDMMHESLVCAARDRICHLSLQNQRMTELLLQALGPQRMEIWTLGPIQHGGSELLRSFLSLEDGLNFMMIEEAFRQDPHTGKPIVMLTESKSTFKELHDRMGNPKIAEFKSDEVFSDHVDPIGTSLFLSVVDEIAVEGATPTIVF